MCIFFIFINVDFLSLLSNFPESLDRDPTECQFYHCSMNNTSKEDNATHPSGSGGGTMELQQHTSTGEQEPW